MSSSIVASVGGAVLGGLISSSGSKSAAAAAATKDSATGTSGYENQSGTNDVTATLKSLGYTDEQIRELNTSQQQQLATQNTSQTGQTQTSNSGVKTDTSTQNQTTTGNQTTAEQLASNLSQSTSGSQTQGTVLNKFQAGNTNPAQQLFDATASGITSEQYQAIVAKAGQDLNAQTPQLAKALATASGTSTANNSGLALGLEQAKQQAAVNAAAQSVAASQANQQIAAGAAGTIAGATTGNNQDLQTWLQQQTSNSSQSQNQTTTGNQTTANNAVTTGSNNQISSDLTNQLATQTGTQTNNTNTTGTQATDRSNQTSTAQNTAQNQSTVSTGTSNYGEASATDVDTTRVPTVTTPVNPAVTGPVRAAPSTTVTTPIMRVENPERQLQTNLEGFADGGLIGMGGSALPGRASGKGTAGARGQPGDVAAAQILMQDATRKATAVNNAAGVLSKYFATPLTDKDGKQVTNADGTPIYPAQNITDALKSATGVGDFFNRLGGDAVKKQLMGGIQSTLNSAANPGIPSIDRGMDFGGGGFEFAHGSQVQGYAEGGQVDADLASNIAAAGKHSEMMREQSALTDKEMQSYRQQPYYHGYEDYSSSGRMALEAYNNYMAQNKLRPDTQSKGTPPYNAAAARYAQQVQQKAQRSLLMGGEPLGTSVDGFSNGGRISGPGTATSDSIPAVVDGKKPIAVSDGEYIIPTHVVKEVGVDFFDNLLANFPKAPI